MEQTIKNMCYFLRKSTNDCKLDFQEIFEKSGYLTVADSDFFLSRIISERIKPFDLQCLPKVLEHLC